MWRSVPCFVIATSPKVVGGRHHILPTSFTHSLEEAFFRDGWSVHVEQDPGECFSSDEEYGDSHIIEASRHFTIVLAEASDDDIGKILWQHVLLASKNQKIMKQDPDCRNAIP